MFFGGWRKDAKKSLRGRSFLSAMEYLRIEHERPALDWPLLLEICQKLEAAAQGKRTLEYLALMEDWKSNNGYPINLLKTANDRVTYKYLCSYSATEVFAASMLMDDVRFAEYFFSTALRNSGQSDLLILFNIFPPEGDSRYLRKLSKPKRDILLNALIDRISSKKILINFFDSIRQDHPFFFLYPELLERD